MKTRRARQQGQERLQGNQQLLGQLQRSVETLARYSAATKVANGAPKTASSSSNDHSATLECPGRPWYLRARGEPEEARPGRQQSTLVNINGQAAPLPSGRKVLFGITRHHHLSRVGSDS